MKNNKKGFTSLVFIGVLVVLLGITGYFVWLQKTKPTTQATTQPAVFNKNGDGFMVSVSGSFEKADQILSTFKFTK